MVHGSFPPPARPRRPRPCTGLASGWKPLNHRDLRTTPFLPEPGPTWRPVTTPTTFGGAACGSLLQRET